MAQIIHSLLLYLILNTGATESKETDRKKEISVEKQLHKDLKADYDFLTTPRLNNSAFSLHVRFILKSFEFLSQEEQLHLFTWMFISWTDERLKWDPAKYDGIDKTEMTTLDIWVPGFRLYNSAESYEYYHYFYAQCSLNYEGLVVCMPRTTHTTACSVKLRNWPYDRQKCSVIYGAYDSHGTVKIRSIGPRLISMVGAEYGAEWTIVHYEQIENQTAEKQLEMVFTLEREAATLASLIVYPSYILIALTLGTLLLDVRCNIRLYLVLFSLFCHHYFLSEIGQIIPKQSVDSPTIILYYRDSEILTIVDFLMTIALRVLCKKMTQPFKMIININDVVYNSFGKYFIFPKWETENEGIQRLGEDDFRKDWTEFANILNSACLIILIVVYICLYCVYMPQPYPMTELNKF